MADSESRERTIALLMVPFILAGATAFGAFGIVGTIIALGFSTAGVVVLGSFVAVQTASRGGVMAWFGGLTALFALVLLIGVVAVFAVPF